MLQGMTVSIGVAPWTPEMSENTLIEIADASLHRAKRSGRNQVILGTSLEALRSDLSPIPSVLDQTAGVDTFIG
jgi:hypothetical protein